MGKTTQIISVISAAVAAVAASYAVYQTRVSFRELQESKRPYITIKAPGIKDINQKPKFRIQIKMRNIGVHPANNLSGKIIIVEKSFNMDSLIEISISLANPVDPGTFALWHNDNLRLSGDMPLHYIVLMIKYSDPVFNHSYSQTRFMKWHGVTAGKFDLNFVHASQEERQEIEDRLKSYLKEFQ